jgi:hypothetical protein
VAGEELAADLAAAVVEAQLVITVAVELPRAEAGERTIGRQPALAGKRTGSWRPSYRPPRAMGLSGWPWMKPIRISEPTRGQKAAPKPASAQGCRTRTRAESRGCRWCRSGVLLVAGEQEAHGDAPLLVDVHLASGLADHDGTEQPRRGTRAGS